MGNKIESPLMTVYSQFLERGFFATVHVEAPGRNPKAKWQSSGYESDFGHGESLDSALALCLSRIGSDLIEGRRVIL